jgi:hypothetical protein
LILVPDLDASTRRSTFATAGLYPRTRAELLPRCVYAQALTIARRCRGVCRDSIGPGMTRQPSGEAQDEHTERSVRLTLEGFAWETLDEEAAREGITTEELITFSVLYYLADIDSGRISRRITRSPYPRRASPEPHHD